ncbi:MAG: DUF1559 domain-containing protein [Pirellulales bacterium]
MSQSNDPGYGTTNPGNQFNPAPKKQGLSGGQIALLILGLLSGIGLFICGGIALMVWRVATGVREAAGYMQDDSNLAQIGLALHNYESVHKRFPAPTIDDAAGRPALSGVISLLPYLEENSTYDRIDLKNVKAWDSPSNIALQGPAPSVLRSFRANDPPESDVTHVFWISSPYKTGGPNTVFSNGRYSQFSDCTDGTSNTLIAIALVSHSQPWAKPSTLTPDEAFALIQKERKYKYVFGLLMDGGTIQIPLSIKRSTFDALVSRDGGESVDPESLED